MFEYPIRSAFAAGNDCQAVLRSCLGQLDGLVKAPGLGILYLTRSLEHDADRILSALRAATGIRDWVGATASRVIGGGRLLPGEGISLLVLPCEPANYRLFDGMADDDDAFRNGLVHATIEQDMQSGLERLLRASNTRFAGAQNLDGLHIAAGLKCGGVSGVAFTSNIHFGAVINRALIPAGPERKLTNIYGDVVAGIDGQDPTIVLSMDVGDILMRDKTKLKDHILTALRYRNTHETSIRTDFAAISDIDHNCRRLTLDRPLRASHIQFLRRDPVRGLTDLEQNLKAGIAGMASVNCCIYIMSERRGARLFGAGTDELSVIRALTGNVPIIGLVSDREVFDSHDEFCSSVALLFGEKRTAGQQ